MKILALTPDLASQNPCVWSLRTCAVRSSPGDF